MLCASGCVLLSCVSHVAHRAVSVRLWCVPCCESAPPHLPVFQGPSGAAPRLAAYVFILINLLCLGRISFPPRPLCPDIFVHLQSDLSNVSGTRDYAHLSCSSASRQCSYAGRDLCELAGEALRGISRGANRAARTQRAISSGGI